MTTAITARDVPQIPPSRTTLTGMETFIEAVQAQLKTVGVNLDIQLVEHATYHSQICDFIDGVIELVNDQPGWASRRERVAQYEQEVFVDETNANHDIDDLISLPNTNNVTKRSLRDG